MIRFEKETDRKTEKERERDRLKTETDRKLCSSCVEWIPESNERLSRSRTAALMRSEFAETSSGLSFSVLHPDHYKSLFLTFEIIDVIIHFVLY